MGLLLCAPLGPYRAYELLLLLFWSLLSSCVLLTLHAHIKLEASAVVWAGSARAFPVKLSQPLSVPYISLSYQETLRNGCFCEVLFSTLPSLNNADVVFTCRVWGFFRFYTKHVIGVNDRLCFCSADDVVVRGFFIYITPPSPKPKNRTSLLFCKVYKVPNKKNWTKQKNKQLPIGAFFCLQAWLWFVVFPPKPALCTSCAPARTGRGIVVPNSVQWQPSDALVDSCVGVQRCHGRQLGGPVEQ